MLDIVAHFIQFSTSRILLALGVAMIFVSLPSISGLIDYTGERVEAKTNITEVNNGVDGLNLTYDEKKTEQYPYINASQMYFDVVNYDGTGYIQLLSDTYVFDKSDIELLRAGDSSSDVYQKITALFSTFSDDDKFAKRVDGDKTIYEQVF